MMYLVAAKQNQKFPFHFLSAPPTPTRRGKGNARKVFGFCSRDRRERTRRGIRAYDLVQSFHALRACKVIGLSAQKKFEQMLELEH